MEAQLPLTYYNLENSEKVTIVGDNEEGKKTFILDEGTYDTAESLAKMIQKKVGFRYCTLRWERGFHLTIGSGVSKVCLTPNLSRLLGLPEILLSSGAPFHSDIEHFDPWVNLHVILIHCDLIREVQVNDRQLPVIQSIFLPSLFNFGDNFAQTFYPIDMHEIRGDSHHVIKIDITNIQGERIKFRSGNVVLKLVLSRDGRSPTDSP